MTEPLLKVAGVGRAADNPNAVLVIFNRPLSDSELRELHGALVELAQAQTAVAAIAGPELTPIRRDLLSRFPDDWGEVPPGMGDFSVRQFESDGLLDVDRQEGRQVVLVRRTAQARAALHRAAAPTWRELADKALDPEGSPDA